MQDAEPSQSPRSAAEGGLPASQQVTSKVGITVRIVGGVSDVKGPPPSPIVISKVIDDDGSSTDYGNEPSHLCAEDYERYDIPRDCPNIVRAADYVRYRKTAGHKRCYTFEAY